MATRSDVQALDRDVRRAAADIHFRGRTLDKTVTQLASRHRDCSRSALEALVADRVAADERMYARMPSLRLLDFESDQRRRAVAHSLTGGAVVLVAAVAAAITVHFSLTTALVLLGVAALALLCVAFWTLCPAL